MAGTHKNPRGVGFHSERTNKGHPRRRARQERAAARLAVHVYDPERCGDECPKR